MNDTPLLPAPDEPLLLTAPEEPLLLPAPKQKAGSSGPSGSKRPGSYRLYWIAAIVLLVLLIVGWFFHHLQANRAKEANADTRDRLPSVGVVQVKASPANSDLLLPGSINPITEASLFARSSGYLTQRFADIGDTVRKGQVLAIVDSPDLDQQVAQGRAAVAQAKQQLGQAEASIRDSRARLDLARITAERTDELGRDNAVAQQEVDQRRQERDTAGATLTMSIANAGAAQANVRASQANADRLVVLQDFEKIRAPFDGIVTARNIDVGALIGTTGGSTASSGTPSASSTEGASTSGSAGSSGSSTTGSSSGSTASTMSGQAMELFRIGQVDRLRVFVSVPQENASAVEPDHDAKVYVAGYAQPFAGRVTRTARSLDPSARTLLTEVQIDNPRHQLMPGMYAQVRFDSPRLSPPLLVPGEAVIARAGGLSVAVIEDLRPEDRQRLPKSKPKEDREKPDDGKKGGDQRDEKSSKGDDKDAKRQPKGKDSDANAKGPDQGDGGDAKPSDDPQDAKRIHLQPIKVGRDYGTEVEVIEGLAAGATIVANPGDDVAEDALVMPRKSHSGGGGSNPDEKGAPPANPSPSMQAPTKGKK